MARRRYLKRTLILLALAYLGLLGYRVFAYRHHVWALGYVKWRWAKTPPAPATSAPKHLLVFYADHFEPGYEFERVDRWVRDYPLLAQRHRDHDGRPLQHTWFYPGEQKIDSNLKALKHLVEAGYGEVEFHHHHMNRTPRFLEREYRDAIEHMQRFGFLTTDEGKTQFGFIHGNFGLDNGRGDFYCGVNEELSLLRSLGAYADFSFPALWSDSQPPIVNHLYEAEDDPKPYSYSREFPFQGTPSARLPIFQGPLVVYPVFDPLRAFYKVEDANIHSSNPGTSDRVDQWVWADMHVPNRPDWVFIKMWGHGAESDTEVQDNLEGSFDQILNRFESRYNDGTRYVLHYVTAREAYNVARAAAAGKHGNPNQYYDFEVGPYRTRAKKVVN